MANKSERRRRRISKSHGVIHSQAEKQFKRSARKWLAAVTRGVVSRLWALGTTQVTANDLFIPGEYHRPWNGTIGVALNRVAWAGWQFEHQWIDSQNPVPEDFAQTLNAPAGSPPPSISVSPGPTVIRALENHLRDRNVGLWGHVSQTTHLQLRKTIKAGLQNGDNLPDMARRIQAEMRHYSTYEAERVARTETTGGMNAGGQAERNAVGIAWKEWISTIDVLNRGVDQNTPFDHIRPDGQTVENRQPYTVSGEFLMFPGDPSFGASAGNVINCRCVSVAAFPATPPKPIKRPRRVKKPPAPPKPKPVVVKPTPPVAKAAEDAKDAAKAKAAKDAAPPKPKTLQDTPKDLTPFGRKVHEAIGPNGIQNEEHARKVGALIRAEVEKHPAVMDAETIRMRYFRRSKKELEKRVALEAEKKAIDASVSSDMKTAFGLRKWAREAREKGGPENLKLYDDAMAEAKRLMAAAKEANKKAAKLFDEINVVAKKRLELIRKSDSAIAEGRKKANLEVLGQVRTMGRDGKGVIQRTGAKIAGKDRTITRANAETAFAHLPADWVDDCENYMDTAGGAISPVEFGSQGRGGFNQWKRTCKAPTTDDAIQSAESVMMHEVGHMVEHNRIIDGQKGAIGKLEQEWKTRRAAGEQLTEIYPGSGEKGYKDKFPQHYVGKVYGGPDYPAHEVLTMGLQGVYHGEFGVLADTDMVEFIYGLLAGM